MSIHFAGKPINNKISKTQDFSIARLPQISDFQTNQVSPHSTCLENGRTKTLRNAGSFLTLSMGPRKKTSPKDTNWRPIGSSGPLCGIARPRHSLRLFPRSAAQRSSISPPGIWGVGAHRRAHRAREPSEGSGARATEGSDRYRRLVSNHQFFRPSEGSNIGESMVQHQNQHLQ